MIELPSTKFPFLKIMKAITTWGFLHDFAEAVDGFITHICQRAAAQPRVLSNKELDGSMQSFEISPPLKEPPSLVFCVVRQAPSTKQESRWPLAYHVEYGTHTASAVMVKGDVDRESGEIERKIKADIIIFP